MILTRAEQMREDTRAAIELMHMPGGPLQFQEIVTQTMNAEPASLDAIARLISVASACLTVVDAGVVEQSFAPWYQGKAQELLRKAMDGVAVLEAADEAKSARLS